MYIYNICVSASGALLVIAVAFMLTAVEWRARDRRGEIN
jgi:hypothetical protein